MNDTPGQPVEISVVLPCLNEAETVGRCVEKARAALDRMGAAGEVIVADNGSTDGSADVAAAAGARVVAESVVGYGACLRRGFAAANGKYFVMADSDDSYDLTEIERFVVPLRNGADMVVGTRLRGEIVPGAMPWTHRYVGVPFLTWALNAAHRAHYSDAHCGMRAVTAEAWGRMSPRSDGMEFASEMLIDAVRLGLRVEEIPITLMLSGRTHPPHLRAFRDGFRHLKLILALKFRKN